MNTYLNDYYISVDIEAAGPSPGMYSLLAIGACAISEPGQKFYIELKPVNERIDPQAQKIHGLSLPALLESGVSPDTAMASFAAWVDQVTPNGYRPVFVAFNAPFDWMFICDYFFRFYGKNPFGHSALDMKAFYMGITGSRWSATSLDQVSEKLLDGRVISHNALEDAVMQGEIFQHLLSLIDSN
jgi:DNA polymerase III epsilon subunit-like protein